MNPAGPRVTIADLADAVAIPAGLAVATFLAATPWLRVFSVPGIAGAAGDGIGGRRCPSRSWRSGGGASLQPSRTRLSAAGLVVLLVASAGLHPAGIWHGLTAGPNRMLTETLPLGGSRAVLAAPLTLTWLCGAASAELVTRAKTAPASGGRAGRTRDWRSRLACYAVAFAVSTSRPGEDRFAAPLLLVTLAAVAVLRRVRVVTAAPEAVRWHRRRGGRPSIRLAARSRRRDGRGRPGRRAGGGGPVPAAAIGSSGWRSIGPCRSPREW